MSKPDCGECRLLVYNVTDNSTLLGIEKERCHLTVFIEFVNGCVQTDYEYAYKLCTNYPFKLVTIIYFDW
jgi:hypothetical protein